MKAELLRQQRFLQDIRHFFQERKVTEVSTACLMGTTVPDPCIASIQGLWQTGRGYLQTSPEFAMKALLAEGSGDIYQIAHAFRDDPVTPWHRREFLMLEWYRVGWTYASLLQEVKDLLSFIPGEWVHVSIKEALALAGWDPEDQASWYALAASQGLVGDHHHPLEVLDFLIQHAVYVHSKYHKGWLVYEDFPEAMASHAWTDVEGPRRFEVYYGSIEIANGCQEETRAEALKQRLMRQQSLAQETGKTVMALDEAFIAHNAALGLISGVAIGLDRYYSVHTQQTSLLSLLHI